MISSAELQICFRFRRSTSEITSTNYSMISVRMGRLELPRCYPLVPETSVDRRRVGLKVPGAVDDRPEHEAARDYTALHCLHFQVLAPLTPSERPVRCRPGLSSIETVSTVSNMYHLTILWIALVAAAYVAGRIHGKRIQRQLGDCS